MRTTLVVCTSLVALPFLSLAATAQNTATPSTTTADAAIAQHGRAIEEVVITAQKRPERLQATAVAAVSIKSAALAQNNVDDISDLSKLIPSVSISGSTNGRVPYAMRGVTTSADELNVGLNSGVAILLDGVPVPSDSHAADQIEDIDHIEVLKGPQATLGGRTAAAGVINMVTHGPTSHLTGAVSSTITTDNEQRISGYVSGAISDQIGFSLSGYGNHLQYPLVNNYNGDHTHVNSDGVRGKLLYRPNEDLTITLAGHYAQSQSYGDNFTYLYLTPGSTLLFPGSPFTQDAELQGINVHDGNLHTNSPSRSIGQRINDRDVSLIVDYKLGRLDLTSTSSFLREQQRSIQDLFTVDNFFFNILTHDQLPFPNNQTIRSDIRQGVEELRLASPASDRLSYLGGLFYSQQAIVSSLLRTIAGGAVNYVVQPTTSTYDAYGRMTYKITPQLSVTGGLRYNYDFLKYTDNQAVFVPFSPYLGPPHPYYAASSYGAGTGVGDIDVQYFFTPRNQVYATYARGYAPAAYNTASPLASDTAAKPVAREDINHFEIGSKGSYLDRSLLVNLAAFYTRYSNYQIETFFTTGIYAGLQNPPLVLANAPAAQTHGVEIDTTYRATDTLTLNLNAAYIDATFVNWKKAPCQVIYLTGTCDNTPGGSPYQDVSGRPLPNSPKFKFTLNAEQRVPMPSIGWDLVLNGNYAYRTSAEMLPDQNPHGVQGPYGILDLSAGLQSQSGRYTATIFVNNVTDKIYYTDVEDFWNTVWVNPAGSNPVIGQPARDARRYAGIRLNASF